MKNSWHAVDIQYQTLFSRISKDNYLIKFGFGMRRQYLRYVSINLFMEIQKFFKSENLREEINNESKGNF